MQEIPPILDFEASSLSSFSYPISVGLYFNNKSYYWIIKPETDWTDWDDRSQAIHGLSRRFIETKGIPVSQVHEELLELLKTHSVVYSDNPDWESKWFDRLGKRHFAFDHVLNLLPENNRNLYPIYFQLVIKRHDLVMHRADHDAKAIALTIDALSKLHSFR